VVIPIFRRGIVAIQAALLSSCVSTHPVGSLRSTGITPLRHYYGPRRLPVGAGPRLCIPAIRCGGHARPAGSLQFPSNRSARAAPNHPGESDGCISYSFTAGAGFTTSGSAARTLAEPELRKPGRPDSRPVSYMCGQVVHMAGSFHPARFDGLSWTLRRHGGGFEMDRTVPERVFFSWEKRSGRSVAPARLRSETRGPPCLGASVVSSSSSSSPRHQSLLPEELDLRQRHRSPDGFDAHGVALHRAEAQ